MVADAAEGSVRGAPVREATNAEDDATWRALNALRTASVTWTDTWRLMLDAWEAVPDEPDRIRGG